MDFPLEFKIFYDASILPECWDSVAGENIFLSTEYMKVLQKSAPTNMICFFIGIFRNSELCGIAISQFIDLSNIKSFGERDHRLKNAIRTYAFRAFSSNVLIVGNNMLTGQNSCQFTESVSWEKGLECLNAAIFQIHKKLSDQGTTPQLTIWKDFSELRVHHFAESTFRNYYRFTTQPNMIFNIRDNWNSVENYISDLNKKYRDQYKRARKKADGIYKRKLSLEDIRKHNTKIYQLYLTVAQNAPFNTFYLHNDHFIELKNTLKEKFLFYGYFLDEKLIGFNTMIVNGADIDTYFLGYDEGFQREKMLYLNMLYDMIGYSVNNRFKRIIFARTALEIKSSVGARPATLYGFIQHSNPFINRFMPRLFKYFEPEMQWQERHPFKD